MKKVITFIFGERVQGEKINLPTFFTQEPPNRPSLQQWVQEFKFGSRYGCRGSFYHSSEHIKTMSKI